MFFELLNVNGHYYTFTATGIKVREKTFASRYLANQHMYKLMDKYGLHIENVWDDNHDKTYLCNNGVRFYIHRA